VYCTRCCADVKRQRARSNSETQIAQEALDLAPWNTLEIEFRDVAHDFHETIEKGYGRIEIWWYWTIAEPDFPDHIPDLKDWKGSNTLVMIRAERQDSDKATHKTCYYIASLDNNTEQALYAVRRRRSIENGLRRVLDIAFREDESRISKNKSAPNSIALRYIALNLPKQEATAKCDTKANRLKAAWGGAYLGKMSAALAA